jgi:hypothetical protein
MSYSLTELNRGWMDGTAVTTSPHNQRVEFLDALAALMGCKVKLGGVLPDGRRPDVLRMDVRRGVLFIGDAKDTESPGCRATQVRLLRYLDWLRAHVARTERRGVFALCFGKEADADRWVETVLLLCHLVALDCSEYSVKRFEPGLLVAAFVCQGLPSDSWALPGDTRRDGARRSRLL